MKNEWKTKTKKLLLARTGKRKKGSFLIDDEKKNKRSKLEKGKKREKTKM